MTEGEEEAEFWFRERTIRSRRRWRRLAFVALVLWIGSIGGLVLRAGQAYARVHQCGCAQ